MALLARPGQPAASGFAGAELESQAEPVFGGGPGPGPGPAVPSIPDGRTDRPRDAAGLLPSSPLVTVSGVCSPHRDGTLMLNKGGGAEHYLYLTLRNLPNSGHRKLCPQRGPVVVAVSTKVK